MLITGMSGTGKSSLVEELRRRGHHAYDADDDGYTEPGSDGRWGWQTDLITELFAEHTGHLLFFAGCSQEQIDLPFDYRVLLTAPRAILINRLRTRTTNTYGATPDELTQILDDLAEIEPLLHRSADLVITTTEPPARIADRLLAHLADVGSDQSP